MNRSTPFLALLTLFALSASAQDWTAIPLGTSGTLRALENTSFSQKYVVGDGGFVAQSNSDRTVWTPVSIGTSADLYSVIQPSFFQTWVGGEAGTVRVHSGGTWNNRSIPSAETFYLFTRSSGVALAAGSGGSIWKSENFGQSWTQHYAGTTPLHAGAGGTSGDGWVVGDDGVLLKGTSNGTAWTPVASGTTRDLHAVRQGASSPPTVMAVGEAGTIVFSTDNGATWTPRLSGTTLTLRDISTSKGNSYWMIAVGDDGVVLRSENNGATWCRLTTGVTNDFYAAEMANNSEYVVAGENGLLLRTTTSGGTCVLGIDATLTPVGSQQISAEGGPLSFTVALTNPSPEQQAFQAWIDAVLPNGSVYGPVLGPQPLTFNPGQSVGPIMFTQNVPAAAPPGNYILRLRVGDYATGALFDESTFPFTKLVGRQGGNGSTMQTADWETLEGSFSDIVAEAVPAEAGVLEAAYPNPVREQATLHFALAEPGPVQLTIYDALGREVARPADGLRAAGRHAVPFDARDLPSGVYVVRLEAGGQVDTRRMTVVR